MKVKVILSNLDNGGAEHQAAASLIEADISAFLAILPAAAKIHHVATALCSGNDADFDVPMHVTTILYEA